MVKVLAQVNLGLFKLRVFAQGSKKNEKKEKNMDSIAQAGWLTHTMTSQ